ncbi:hypothetical protein IEQ_04925 [Bacillus cereus BAG6X1-2]|nr:hypothetical protein IEQ_04925 [Bacillus cereus BAG6X1-2]
MRKAYMLTLGSFVAMFFVLCISPAFSGATYKLEEMKAGEYQSLSSMVKISVVKKNTILQIKRCELIMN